MLATNTDMETAVFRHNVKELDAGMHNILPEN